MKPLKIINRTCFLKGHDWKPVKGFNYDEHRFMFYESIKKFTCKRCRWDDFDTWDWYTSLQDIWFDLKKWIWTKTHPGKDWIPF